MFTLFDLQVENKEKKNWTNFEKMHTVRYKKTCYICNTKDCLKILFFKTILFFRRFFRRIGILVSAKDMIMYLCILGAWIVFIVVNNVVDINLLGFNDSSWVTLIKEFRGSVFSTIFIAFLINSINHISEHKKILRYQYYTYINTMFIFETLFFDMYEGRIELVHNPLYNDNRLTKIREVFRFEWRNLVFDNKKIRQCWKNIYYQVTEIEKDCKEGLPRVKSVDEFLSENRILKETFGCFVNYRNQQWNFEYISRTMLLYLDEIRYIWRKDIDLDKKIIRVLGDYEENNTVLYTYYGPLLEELGVEDKRKL